MPKPRGEGVRLTARAEPFQMAYLDDLIAYGVNAGFVLRQLDVFIRGHFQAGRHQHDGRTFNYCSVAALTDTLPFLTRKQVRKALADLLAAGVLVAGRYGDAWDQTLWYAFADEEARFGVSTPVHDDDDEEAGYDPDPCPPGQRTVAPEGNGQLPPRSSVLQERTKRGAQQTTPRALTDSEHVRGDGLFGSGEEHGQDSPPTRYTLTGDVKVTEDQSDPSPPGSGAPPRAKPKAAATFDPASREHQAATWTYRHLLEAESPHVVAVEAKGGGAAEVQKWAAEFDRMHRIDGVPWEDVALVLGWLFKQDDWWVSKGNFQTATKLRQKNRDGLKWHHVFLARARDAAKQQIATPSPEDQGAMFDRLRARASRANG